MCEPITVAAGAMLAGSALQGAGAIQQGQAAYQASQYNIAMGDIAAQDALERADVQKQQLALNFLQEKGTGRTQTAAAGIRIGTGSSLDWENDLSQSYVADKANIDLQARKQVQGIRAQQVLDNAQGQSARVAGYLGATSSLLSGAGKAGSMMYTPGG